MSKPILRVGKIKRSGAATLSSVGAHLHRTRPTPNADPARSGANRTLIGDGSGSLDEAVASVMRRAHLDPAGLRKDATIANDIVLTISPEWFRPDDPELHGTYDPARLAQFEAATTEFLRATFGARVAQAVLHLDEATPHVHAVIVPIMPKFDKAGDKAGWRLSGKDMFGPDALSALQQGWEDRLAPLGVGQRTLGSRARHTTLHEYYSALEAHRSDGLAPPVKITQPPQKGFLEGSTAHTGRVDEWRRSEAKRLRAERAPLERAAAQGRLYEAERLAGTESRALAGEQAAEIGRLREQVADLDTQVERGRDEIAALRATPINAVAATLGFTGAIGPKENSIDLVKRIGGLSYRESLAWLAQRFGPETAATAAREHAAGHLPEIAATLVQTSGERVKSRLISEQLDALAAPSYRLTVMSEIDGKKIGKNLGKQPEGQPERVWTRDEILTMIPRLTAHNARNGNIFITPLDGAVHHVLVDDLSTTGLADLRQRGFAPATVTETSPANFQAILKIPRSAGDTEHVNAFFKDLNKDIGDAKITGLQHPFRLAGFENRKEKHVDPATGLHPFVRLVEAVNRTCRQALLVVRRYAQEAPSDRPRGPRR